jgi:hypothetical protein
MNGLVCPRCATTSPEAARYCRQCGLPLIADDDGLRGAGRVPHPEPLSPPRDHWPIEHAQDLHFRWQAAGGGTPLLGTEALEVWVFNGGYDLVDVVLATRGEDAAGQTVFRVERELASWPRGETQRLEIPSWELADRVQGLRVALVRAAFDTDE